MSVYYLAEIRHAAIGHFDGVPIENFPEGVIWGEGGFHYIKEISSNSGFTIEGPRWVKPDHIFISVSFPFARIVVAVGWFRFKFHFKRISRFVQGILERRGRFLKDFLIC